MWFNNCLIVNELCFLRVPGRIWVIRGPVDVLPEVSECVQNGRQLGID